MKAVLTLCIYLLASAIVAGQTLDNSFGTGRIALVANDAKSFFPQSIVQDQDSRIYIAALDCESLPFCDSVVYLYRLSPDGNIDTSFGDDGFVALEMPTGLSSVRMHLYNDTILVAGDSGLDKTEEILCLSKLHLSGERISSFGTNGIKNLSQIDGLPVRAYFLSPNNHVYLIGQQEFGTSREVYRLDDQGDIDSTFGNDGVMVLEGRFLATDHALSMKNKLGFFCIGTLDSSGYEGPGSVFIVEAFSFNGNRLTEFGDNGVALSDTISNTFSAGIPLGFYNVSLSETSILMAGNAAYSDNAGMSFERVIVKFQLNGDLDMSFGRNGLLTNPAGYLRDYSSGWADEIYTFGASNSTDKLVSYSYNPSGQLASEYGDSGVLQTAINQQLPSYAFGGGYIQEDGKLLHYGRYHISDTEHGIIIARFADINTGFPDVAEMAKPGIFPNPAQNTLHLPNELSSQNLRLYNSQGRQFEVVQPNPDQLDISHLAPGMYVLQAGERVWRFVKE